MNKAEAGWKIVRISMDVFGEIAKRGCFGENVDDVLRRILELPEDDAPRYSHRRNAVKKGARDARITGTSDNGPSDNLHS